MSGQNIGLIALGAVFLSAGLALIAERKRVSDWNNAATRRSTGGRDGSTPGRRMTAGMMTALGTMVGIMGAVILVLGFTVNAAGNGGGAGGMALSCLLGLVFAAPFWE